MHPLYLSLLATLLLWSTLCAQEATAPRDFVPTEPLSEEARPFTDLGQLSRGERMRRGRPQGELAGNRKRTARGFSEEVYPRVAPAVVVVQNYYCHGTGFFIREDGWLLTNNHVVEDCDYDAELGGQVATINVGVLDQDGWMKVVAHPVRALVYKTDVRQDLALLKLLELPPGVEKVPVVPFARSVPRPGSGVVAIGHPAAGTLWTLRSGEIAGAGVFPEDQMDRILFLLGVAASERSYFEEALRQDPERKQVLLSTCGLNPGDSGGPLVNANGELVAVSYAVPTIDFRSGVDRGKFSFHIHMQEIDEFLSLWPDTPIVAAPNPRPAGMYYELQDRDGDGRFDTLVIANEPEGEPVGVLVDLDQDSYGGRSVSELQKAGGFPPADEFDYEFAVSTAPHMRIAYDTDNDGAVDLVFSDEDHDAELETQIRFADREWTIRRIDSEVVSPQHFADATLRSRFKAYQSEKPGKSEKSSKKP